MRQPIACRCAPPQMEVPKHLIVTLDYYLWRIGKEPRFRQVERHYTRDTVYY